MTIIKDEAYWKLHKELINNKLNKLDNDDYNDAISNPDSLIIIKIKNEVEEEIFRRTKEKSLPENNH